MLDHLTAGDVTSGIGGPVKVIGGIPSVQAGSELLTRRTDEDDRPGTMILGPV
jgi:hypothetical protein